AAGANPLVFTVFFDGPNTSYRNLPQIIATVVDPGSAGLGVTIFGLSDGRSFDAPNVISGNSGNGVHLAAAGVHNLFVNNHIGTNAAGPAGLGNAADGVLVSDTPDVDVAGNVISGNGGDGIEIAGAASTGGYVLGNFIGTDATGSIALGNASNGVRITSGASG